MRHSKFGLSHVADHGLIILQNVDYSFVAI